MFGNVCACLHYQSYLFFLDGFVKINRKLLKLRCIFFQLHQWQINCKQVRKLPAVGFTHKSTCRTEYLRQSGAFRFSSGRSGWYRPSPVLWREKKQRRVTLTLWVIIIWIISCHMVPSVESTVKYPFFWHSYPSCCWHTCAGSLSMLHILYPEIPCSFFLVELLGDI